MGRSSETGRGRFRFLAGVASTTGSTGSRCCTGSRSTRGHRLARATETRSTTATGFFGQTPVKRRETGRSRAASRPGETALRSRPATFLQAPYDNTNIIAERIGGEYTALTESPRQARFDPATLATTDHAEYSGDVPTGQRPCAQLKRDPATGTLVNVDTEFGRPSQYHVHATARLLVGVDSPSKMNAETTAVTVPASRQYAVASGSYSSNDFLCLGGSVRTVAFGTRLTQGSANSAVWTRSRSTNRR